MATSSWLETLPPVGNYDLLQKIAEGGMSAVYRGRNRSTGEIVAVKVIAPDKVDHPTLRERFQLEYEAGRDLDHPHLVRSLDFGELLGVPYMVLEYVDGTNLGELVEQHGRLPVEEVIRIIAQVAGALDAIHERGLVHRDVKPHNILLREDGQAKLIDLGLVKSLEQDLCLTRPRVGMGTHHFVAPEQFTDARLVDRRADVYALAATSYFLVTGVWPFADRTVYQILKMKLHDRLAAPRQLVPDLKESVNRAILRAMSARPEHRPGSCAAFLDELMGRSKPVGVAGSSSWTDGDRRARGERRATVRYPAQLLAACGAAGAVHRYLWYGQIHDISTTGLQLVMRRRFDVGTLLFVEFQDAGQRAVRGELVRVARVEAQPYRKWAMGCVFAQPLSEEEVRALQ